MKTRVRIGGIPLSWRRCQLHEAAKPPGASLDAQLFFPAAPAAPRDIVRHFELWPRPAAAFLAANRRQFAYEVGAFARHRVPATPT